MAIIATWQLSTMCSSDCEARSMATKRQRVSTRSSDSSVADKKKRRQVSVATVTVVAALYDGTSTIHRSSVRTSRILWVRNRFSRNCMCSAREDSNKLHDVDCAEIQKQSNTFA